MTTRKQMLSLMGLSNDWIDNPEIVQEVQRMAKELCKNDRQYVAKPKMTELQQKIVELINKGHTNQQISEMLGCSSVYATTVRRKFK